ncbi:MAG: hypothetical protein M1133_05125 [Armatimonadetes bacterium]|nr:hypothetical protein [Armatimonadota bacterium]
MKRIVTLLTAVVIACCIASAWEFAVLGYVILIGVVGDAIHKTHRAKRVKPKG